MFWAAFRAVRFTLLRRWHGRIVAKELPLVALCDQRPIASRVRIVPAPIAAANIQKSRAILYTPP